GGAELDLCLSPNRSRDPPGSHEAQPRLYTPGNATVGRLRLRLREICQLVRQRPNGTWADKPGELESRTGLSEAYLRSPIVSAYMHRDRTASPRVFRSG